LRSQSLLDEHHHTTRVERLGQYRSGALVLDIESMHHLKGSPLPPQEAGGGSRTSRPGCATRHWPPN